MSTSSPERFKQADAVFDAALDLPPQQQGAFVDRECAADPELGAEVHRLLRAHRHGEGFLASPAVELAAPLLHGAAAPDAASPPARIGPFRVVRELGRGGMGAVYLAERADGQFDQRVALKLIRHAGGDEVAVRRFREERRILALLEHPGIARLLDGGVTDDGQPYFAMELVEGQPIDRHCDDARLPIDRRLALVLAVCDAVEYAHQQLVVHRDLKPSNILVTADGAVKLLDFGIAKLVDPVATPPDGPVTGRGAVPMTPEYASPEQILGQPVSTAADIYALGVVLYQLLTGRRPYEVRGRTPAEVERIVCEEDPLRPSSTFGDRSGALDAAERARVRGAVPDRLRRHLAGDLDVIVMKALSKEPARRYASVAALAEDLRRYADGRPVLARAPTSRYRLRKFVGRHRAAVAAGVLIAGLLAGLGWRERVLRERAETEAGKARAVREYLVSVFDVADPYAARPANPEEVTVRALLDRGAARIDSGLTEAPAEQAELRLALGRVYANLGVHDSAAAQLRAALERRRALYGQRHPDVAEAMGLLGDVLVTQHKLDEAEPLLREALAQHRAFSGDRHPFTARTLDNLARLLQERNDLAGAEPLLRDAVAIRRTLGSEHAQSLATSLINLGVLMFRKGAYDAADSLYRDAVAVRELVLGPDHPLTAQITQNLAQVQHMRGKLDEAERLHRRALAAKRKSLGSAHPSVTISLNNLASLIGRELGKLDEAEALVREALALDRQMFGERHGYVAASLDNLGTILRMKGDFDGAEAAYRQALTVNEGLFGKEHHMVALNLNNIGNIRLMKGDAAGSATLIGEAHAIYTKLLGDEHPSTLAVGGNLGRALRERGDFAAAERVHRGMLASIDPEKPQLQPQLIAARAGLGQVLTATGRLDEARPLLEQAVEMAVARFGSDDVRTGEAQAALGSWHLASKRYAEAEPLLRQSHRTLQKHARSQPLLAARIGKALERLEAATRGGEVVTR